MQLYIIRIVSLVVIALVYMLFDIFNKRNVPSSFVYGTLAYGILLTVLYFNLHTIGLSLGIAAVITGIGYIIYRIGQLGLADVIEFAAISLILPIQKAPLLITSAMQLNTPFIFSLLVNTGIVVIIVVPIYYIPKAIKKAKKPISTYITKREILMSALLAGSYLIFILLLSIIARPSYVAIAILAIMMICSVVVALFAKPITNVMIEYVSVSKFEEGDIIAINLMDGKTLDSLKKRVKGFGRLVTPKLIKEMKLKKVNEKLPVYKKAMPFAVPIFIGIVLAILLGNILFLVLGI
jgi:Flp pilus assembly protein protease CpaA